MSALCYLSRYLFFCTILFTKSAEYMKDREIVSNIKTRYHNIQFVSHKLKKKKLNKLNDKNDK